MPFWQDNTPRLRIYRKEACQMGKTPLFHSEERTHKNLRNILYYKLLYIRQPTWHALCFIKVHSGAERPRNSCFSRSEYVKMAITINSKLTGEAGITSARR